MVYEARGRPSGRPQSKPFKNKGKDDGDFPLHRRKKKKPNPFDSGVARPKKYSIAPLKNRIRDLKRQLARMENLPADIRVSKERELAAAERELDLEKKEKLRQELVGKYHMVRFFDRRKAERRLKKAKRALQKAEAEAEEQGSEDIERCKRDVEDKETEIAYTQFYPLMMKYESLFPTSKGKEKAEDEQEIDEPQRKGSEEMWKVIQEAMAKGKDALMALRESEPEPSSEAASHENNSKERPSKKTNRHEAAKKSKSRVERPGEADDKEDDSDGGFFE